MYAIGIIEEPKPVFKAIKTMIEEEDEVKNLPIITAFIRRCGDFLLGVKKKEEEEEGEEEIPEEEKEELKKIDAALPITPPEIRKPFIALLNSYFDKIADLYVLNHEKLKGKEAEHRRVLQAKGQLSEKQTQTYLNMRESHAALQKLVEVMEYLFFFLIFEFFSSL